MNPSLLISCAPALKRMLACALLTLVPAVAVAQPYVGSATPHKGSWEVGGGVTWTGGYGAGEPVDATEPRPGSTTPLTLFTVSGRVLSVPGARAHVGIFLSNRVSVEAAVEYNRPVLRVHVTNDFESAADTDTEEAITSYLAGGSLLYHFGEGRLVPFVSGGAGYLRQLHEGNADLLTGTEIHGGGGLKYWLGTGTRRFGLRVDAALSARSKTVAFVPKRQIVPSLVAGLSYVF